MGFANPAPKFQRTFGDSHSQERASLARVPPRFSPPAARPQTLAQAGPFQSSVLPSIVMVGCSHGATRPSILLHSITLGRNVPIFATQGVSMTLAYFSLFLGISASLLGQELSRKEAERIIDSVEGFRQANSFNLPRDRQACGERQGLWRTGQWAFEIGPKGRSFLKAVRYNAATGNLMVTTIGAHNRYVRAITGVSDAQNGLKQADFFFEWQ